MYISVNKWERERKRETSVVLLMIQLYVYVESLTWIYLRICSERDITLHDTNVANKIIHRSEFIRHKSEQEEERNSNTT